MTAFAGTEIRNNADGSISYSGEYQYPLELEAHLDKICPAMSVLDLNPQKSGNEWIISAEDLASYTAKEKYCEAEALKIAKKAVKDGMAVRDAAKAAAQYYAYGYRYADGNINGYQSSFQQLMTGMGVCASNSRLFRITMEQVPFKNGAVDWENGTDHIDVKLVNSDTHTWNTITVGGRTYVYDIVSYEFGVPNDAFPVYQNVRYML